MLDTFVIFSDKKLQDYLIKTLKSMLEGDSVELVKTGYNILSYTLENDLYMQEDIVDFIVELIKM